MIAKIGLEFGIHSDVALVVTEQVELHLIDARSREIEVVERVPVGRNRGRVCHTVVSGDRKARRALRFASDGSCQYARIGFQPSLRPSTYALPFCEMIAVMRSGCLTARRKPVGAP